MKNMKKKVVIIAAMVLLLAAVLVMSISTFAKYTESATVESTTATAAKWGFVVKADASKLWGANYGALADGKVVVADSGVNVKATSAAVAPGTSGVVTFNLDGTAEVPVEIAIMATGTDLVLTHTETGKTYSPVQWTLKKGDAVVNSLENTTLAAVVDYLNGDADTGLTEEVEAGATGALAGAYTLSWTWAFDNTAATDISGLNGNQADTIMGQIAAGTTVDGYTMTTLQFSLDVAVEQIQK